MDTLCFPSTFELIESYLQKHIFKNCDTFITGKLRLFLLNNKNIPLMGDSDRLHRHSQCRNYS